jgi:signal peptide peptidase SppA
MKISALDAALNAVWAMEERSLEMLLEIAARDHDVSPEALEAYSAKSIANAQRARVRDGVAVLDAIGPLFRRANLMTAISGATSYDILRQDLQAVIDDPAVKAVILNIDSPGGEANGTSELAEAVYGLRGKKPIIAYIGGTGASAAYWLASAADKIVIAPTAVLGSIGVQVAYRESAARPGEKTYRFVSSQSPNKNPELGTPAASEQIQNTIDAMAAVFVADVARNRGVATETVLTDFGKGGIFVGQTAVDAGMADSIGTFETVLADLSGGKPKFGNKGHLMADETFTAEQRDSAVTAAVTAENERVAGLVRLADAHNAHAKLSAAITAKTSVADFALALADDAKAAATAAAEAAAAATAAADATAKEDETKRLAALKTDETLAGQAAVSTGTEPGAAKAGDKLVDEIIAAANAAAGE